VGSPEYNETLAKLRLAYVTNFMGITNEANIQLKPYGLVRKYDVKDYKSWRRVDVYYSSNQHTEIKDTTQREETIEQQTIINETIGQQIQENQPKEIAGQTSVNLDTMVRYTNENLAYILNVEFIEGSAKMDLKSQAEVKKFADFMNEHPNLSVLIRGHVCCGNNMRISKARAKAVYHELIKQGIAKKRLDYVGMSNTEPLVFPEKTNADRQRNRRVDVKFKVIDL
jgi:OOP family OmpA-OmpF porin